jgi:hypothetical protein
MKYNNEYYKTNAQDKDRPALFFYQRIWEHYLSEGPVLDFGSGVGHFAKRLSNICDSVFAYELQDYARNQILVNAPNVNLIEGLTALSENSIKSITALHVLEHISDGDLAGIGTHFNRVLISGGRLLVVMPNLDGLANNLKGSAWSAFTDITHINLKSSEGWEDFFSKVWGMKKVTSFSDGFYDFPYETGWRRFRDLFRLGLTGLQFILGRGIIDPDNGENVVFILERT